MAFDSIEKSRILWPIILTITAIGVAVVWATASPVSSAPDEPAHLIYAWGLATGQGPDGTNPGCDEISGECFNAQYDIPVGAVPNATCHMFDRRNSGAGCEAIGSPAVSNLARYPPPFYLAVGLSMRAWIGFGGDPSGAALVGRLTSSLISLSMVVPALLLLRRSRPLLTGMLILLFTPMALFLMGSANPSGVEIAAALAAAVAVVGLRDRGGPLPSILMIWSTFWLATSRPVGWLWAALLVGFALVWLLEPFLSEKSSALRRLVPHRVPFGISLVWISFGVAWFVYAIQQRNTENDTGLTIPETTTGRIIALVLRWGDISQEAIGIVGWLDTPMPALILLGVFGGLTASTAIAFTDHRSARRRWLNLAHFLLVVALITFIMERQSFLWQGRYAMPPLAACLVFVFSETTERSRQSIHLLIQGTWALTGAGSLWVYARYAWGITIGPRYQIPNFTNPTPWESPLTTEFFIVLCVGLWALGAVLIGGLLRTSGASSEVACHEGGVQ